jgi:hypothetical protein
VTIRLLFSAPRTTSNCQHPGANIDARHLPGSIAQCEECGGYLKRLAPGAYDPDWGLISPQRARKLLRHNDINPQEKPTL